jgi:hypothetical protein
MSAANSSDIEAARRFVQTRLPHGTQGSIALECGRSRRRVADEVEGHIAMSLDVFLLAAGALPLEDRLRVIAHVLEPIGLKAEPNPAEPL